VWGLQGGSVGEQFDVKTFLFCFFTVIFIIFSRQMILCTYPKLIHLFHNGFICDSSKLEATQISTNSWIDEQIASPNGILLSNKKANATSRNKNGL
jgi:hypothetical protein